jgi:hypothetical protein
MFLKDVSQLGMVIETPQRSRFIEVANQGEIFKKLNKTETHELQPSKNG